MGGDAIKSATPDLNSGRRTAVKRIPFPTGSGLFETMRTEEGEIAELSRHMRRAASSARELSIPFPDEEFLRNAIAEILTRESLPVGRLRICFSTDGIDLSHSEYSDEINPARITFHSTSSKLDGSQHKTYPYDSHFAILDEANLYGFDDAITFNQSNEVAETAIANIALLIEGKWITPPISAGVLPGVMRAIAIERSDVSVAPIHISDISRCEAALLLNSMKIARPVSHIGDYELPAMAQAVEKASQIREKVEYFSVS
jgi:branched-subunit amino acid aminotransferase/4-amino-4-deoxychorismate lyase